MKRIILIRHAKSSWKDEALADFERPLNKRGKRDAPMMARRMCEYDAIPDLMLVSPANRAKLTCQAMASILGYAMEQVQWCPALYEADCDTILQQIQQLPDQVQQVVLIGHNPGLNQFIWQSSDFPLDNLPTCGVFGLCYAIEQWQYAGFHNSRFCYYDYPKNVGPLIRGRGC